MSLSLVGCFSIAASIPPETSLQLAICQSPQLSIAGITEGQHRDSWKRDSREARSINFVSTPCVVTSLNAASTLCIKEERVTLLKFKKDLKDPHNCLSSWVGNDCCNWTGIECDNQTGHILKLDLQRTYIGGDKSFNNRLETSDSLGSK
ncbi:hypothetical protein JHK87_050659 [Glycine soja]|nr:hypothetical protein JHK87_050659 [Glycine soja]